MRDFIPINTCAWCFFLARRSLYIRNHQKYAEYLTASSCEKPINKWGKKLKKKPAVILFPCSVIRTVWSFSELMWLTVLVGRQQQQKKKRKFPFTE